MSETQLKVWEACVKTARDPENGFRWQKMVVMEVPRSLAAEALGQTQSVLWRSPPPSHHGGLTVQAPPL